MSRLRDFRAFIDEFELHVFVLKINNNQVPKKLYAIYVEINEEKKKQGDNVTDKN